jgi:arylsulfatase A-like enzyme
MGRSFVTLIVWYLAFAAMWAAADIAQVSKATGGQPMLALGLLALVLWSAVGLVAGAVAFAATAALRLRRTAPPWAAGAVGFALVAVGSYVNIVTLPSVFHPLTIAANVTMAAAAAFLWRLLSRSEIIETIGGSRPAATGLWIASLAVCAWFAAGASTSDERGGNGEANAGMPDVVVIVIDTLRLDRTGIDGNSAASRTPALDDLAARGLAFTNAYAQSSWTKPSVASLFTSLFPSTHGANFRRDRLPASPVTLPELFAAAGYRTAVFSANPWISPAFGFERGVDFFVESEPESFVRLLVLPKLWKAPDGIIPSRPMGSILTRLEDFFSVRGARRSNCLRDAALLESFRDWFDAAGETPSFAYMHLMSPHIPYDPPHAGHDFPNAEQVGLLQSAEPLDPDRHEGLLALYDATVEHSDEILGAVVETLDHSGALDDTIVVVTADHGEEFFEHGGWGHGKSLYDELVNVPLVIAGRAVPPAVREDPAMVVDIMPTLADMLSLPNRADWEGRSLLLPDHDRSAYAELVREGGMSAFMVYRGNRKYIESVDRLGDPPRRSYFSLDKDPGELQPLPAERAEDLRKELESLRSKAESKRMDSSTTSIDDDAESKLRALGYVD